MTPTEIAARIFVLSYSDWDEYRPKILIGPEGMTPERFHSVCGEALSDAARAAVAHADGGWVGLDSIVDEATLILCERGFTRVLQTEHGYSGPGIILDPGEASEILDAETLAIVIAHNKTIEAVLDARERQTR